MSHPIPPPEISPLQLPELVTSMLDAAGLEALLQDISQCTELLGIVPKYAPTAHVPEGADQLTLDQARELIRLGQVRGLQLRYRYEGAEWWDTLMNLGAQWRVVRIRHDWAGGA